MIHPKLTLRQILHKGFINVYVLVYKTDIAPARFLCALSAMVMGCLMLMPGVDLSQPEYIVFSNIMSHDKWASLYLVVGSVNMYTLVARVQPGWYTPLLAAIQMFVWVTTTAALAIPWLNGHRHISSEGAVAWMSVWIMIRSHDGSEDDIHVHEDCHRRCTDRFN